MTSKTKLSHQEVSLIASAINWTLHVPFSLHAGPVFTPSESETLEANLASMIRLIHSPFIDAEIFEDQLRIDDQLICSDRHGIELILVCLQAFDREIGHSTVEVRVVTGLPIERLKALVSLVEPLSKQLVPYHPGFQSNSASAELDLPLA